MIRTKTNIVISVLNILAVVGVVILLYIQNSEEIRVKSNNEENVSVDEAVTDIPEVTKGEKTSGNQVVSIFSWYMELSNEQLFQELSKPLVELGINRVYQIMPADFINNPEMTIMIKNFSDIGMETVVLTGDKSWVIDGLTEYKQIVDSIALYNESAKDELKIKAVALDVEVHALEKWETNSVGLFQTYVKLMKQAREYANEKGLEVIQVIPVNYDEVDTDLFDTFLQECCDEVSIMNYNRSLSAKAIKYEVLKCKEYNIPVETIFETMPLSKIHEVTEELTYYYDGMEALQNDIPKLRKVYGNYLGIAYHHYSTVYDMCVEERLGEIRYRGFGGGKDMGNPGNILLYGDDGSILVATPYWRKAQKKPTNLRWLVSGVKEDVSYSAIYYDLYQNNVISEAVSFEEGENLKLQAVID